MSQPARIPRQRADLIRALREQRELLQNAADRYDAGSDVEAKNLALRVRVLLHDSRSSHSLLGQLSIKEVLPYLDTTNPDPPPGVLHFDAGLCTIHGVTGPDGHSRYLPALTNMDPERWHPPQAFVDWWSVPVVSDNSGAPVSRSEFVLWLANEDGGAHVDPSVKGAYDQLSRSGLDTFRPEHGDDPRFKDLVAPSVRQIAFELEKTFEASLVEDGRRFASRRGHLFSSNRHEGGGGS